VYNADGLRVRQGADTFTWDWATSVPEVLRDGDSLYLVGHDTLGWQSGADWTYAIPDALGSVRQETGATGIVTDVREWSPYGEELGGAQNGLGYTGEWFDARAGLTYLRARWYDSATGRFISQDTWEGNHNRSQSLNGWIYVEGNPTQYTDPSGHMPVATAPLWWIDMLTTPYWKNLFMDMAARHNMSLETGLSNEQFSAILASIVLIEGGNVGGASDPSAGFTERVKHAIGWRIGGWPDKPRLVAIQYIKTGEIWFNKWLEADYPEWMIGLRACQIIARDKIGLQSEGIVNISPEIKSQIQEYGIDVQKYDLFWKFSVDPRELHGEDLAWIWHGQEKWIEYLAASFHMVTIMARQHGVDLSAINEEGDVESIRAFSQWHSRGIVQAFPVERLGTVTGAWYSKASLDVAETAWATKHREAQEFSSLYYKKVRDIMWDPLTIWAQ